jgi:hypothetical protein
MRTLRTLAMTVVVAAIGLVPTAAFADGPWGNVNCDLTPNDPQCNVVVINPGHNGSDGGGGGSLTCRLRGEIVPCYTKGFGWLGGDGCYYGKDSGGFLPANQYIKRCLDRDTGNLIFAGIVLLNSPPATLAMMIQRAVSQLKMPRPVIKTNPKLDEPGGLHRRQVVYVPVWWWVQPGLWRTHTATASLPGISITARAIPTKITWNAGDGTTKVCHGPGTPWTADKPANAPSPTCGHTYTTPSRTSPGGKFTLRAAVTWTISWSGGGLSGTEPPAATTDTARVEVTEWRAVITT